MRFAYLEPSTVAEAVSLLVRYDGKARVMAGGTDLMVQMKNRSLKADYVIDIGGITSLRYVRDDGQQGLRIGALTTMTDLAESSVLRQKYPVISCAAGLVGSEAIRNVATIGGNLCNALPSADSAPGLIALGSQAQVTGPDGERVVLLEDFMVSPRRTILKLGEILTEVRVPALLPGTRGVYLKYGRSPVDLAVVGTAVVATVAGQVCHDIRIVLASVAQTPIRARRAEDSIRGQRLDEAAILACAQVAADECRPREGSIRASPEYKKTIVRKFVRTALHRVGLP